MAEIMIIECLFNGNGIIYSQFTEEFSSVYFIVSFNPVKSSTLCMGDF